MKAMPNLPTSAWLLALLGMIGLAGCGRSASTVELQTGGGPKVDLGNGVMMELVPLRPGTFTMGEGRDAHQVTLTKPFWLGRTEATQAQWEALMGGNPSIIKDVGREAPVEHVSWEDAMQFCRKLRISVRLNSQGEIAEIIKAEGDSGDYGMSVALTALKEHAPYRAWTKEMVGILGADQEVTFTFYYW